MGKMWNKNKLVALAPPAIDNSINWYDHHEYTEIKQYLGHSNHHNLVLLIRSQNVVYNVL